MGNIYEKGFSSPAEIERLKKLDFPLEVSEKVIGDPNDKSLVDIGSGPNPTLGQWVEKGGGEYVALDTNPPFLGELKKAKLEEVVRADCKDLPLEDESVDVSHLRFVLMHFPALSDRIRIIEEALRVAKEKAVFLEYDWNDFEALGLIGEIKNIAIELLGKVSDPYYGAKLETEVKAVLEKIKDKDYEVSSEKFSRPKLPYTEELEKMIGGIISLSQKIDPSKTERLEQIQEEIKSVSEEALAFVPPSIKAVIIEKTK
jgi:ubiquinone/menaquinone biosynthesis C-methylase UbiE